eukprot:gnl/MRDRNA2_/MRDRNA2_41160_c0_seq2.p1 gnl/MRDRNA2_/MRDRNA2_41160_c0~~gnl/MRDRNA2_/MRDRNA2_41160_c0_seq2.p1  ORF type:complete len:740 (-),score=186.41 gnl/MRDRNA2_/MRDRNA2_41160_c0_seq2:92-2311(-)
MNHCVAAALSLYFAILACAAAYDSSDDGACPSLSDTAFAKAEAAVGDSLLAATQSLISQHATSHHDRKVKTHAHPRPVSFIQNLAMHSAWRQQHHVLKRVANESHGSLDTFIQEQAESGDACSARLMESKRALDGLMKDLKAIEAQVESHEEVLSTETENLNITHNAIDAVEATNSQEVEMCKEEKQEAQKDVIMHTKELQELEQIAKPSVRFQEATEAAESSESEHSSSLLQTTKFTHNSCLAFKEYVKHAALKGVQPAKNMSCDSQREALQQVFTETYLLVQELLHEARENVEDGSCIDAASAKRTSELVPLTTQREQASGRIESSAQAVALLEPVLNMLKNRVEKLEKYIETKLSPECSEASKVSETLKAVRELILSLQKCPGRNDFSLKIPETGMTKESIEQAQATRPEDEDSMTSMYKMETEMNLEKNKEVQQNETSERKAASEDKVDGQAKPVKVVLSPSAAAAALQKRDEPMPLHESKSGFSNSTQAARVQHAEPMHESSAEPRSGPASKELGEVNASDHVHAPLPVTSEAATRSDMQKTKSAAARTEEKSAAQAQPAGQVVPSSQTAGQVPQVIRAPSSGEIKAAAQEQNVLGVRPAKTNGNQPVVQAEDSNIFNQYDIVKKDSSDEVNAGSQQLEVIKNNLQKAKAEHMESLREKQQAQAILAAAEAREREAEAKEDEAKRSEVNIMLQHLHKASKQSPPQRNRDHHQHHHHHGQAHNHKFKLDGHSLGK